MNLEDLKKDTLTLSAVERQKLLKDLSKESTSSIPPPKRQSSRCFELDNKLSCSPHCLRLKYAKFDIDKSTQRHKYKSCERSFTEHTGTWMTSLLRKDKLDSYLALILEEKSLDKIKIALSINKKIAFDWRHKIIASLSKNDKEDFIDKTESDEIFFLSSENGRPVNHREPRKRRGSSKNRDISNNPVAVTIAQDRKSNLDLTEATMGRLKKTDIKNTIGRRIKASKTVSCNDAHKSFAIDNEIEHHSIKASIYNNIRTGILSKKN